MCGIFAASRLTEFTKPMLPLLAWEMKKRGTDAWGGSDGEGVIKHVGSITDSWELPANWTRGIFHTRAATTGTGRDVENAHPFTFTRQDGWKIIGVHNGIIRNHTELNKKYNRDFPVDSMHAYAHIIEGKPLNEIEGYGALVWWEGFTPSEMRMCMAKFNMWDLHALRLDTGELVICSKDDPIRESCTMFGSGVKSSYKLDDNTKYIVGQEDGTDILLKCESLPFGNRGYNYSGTGGGSTRGNYSQRNYQSQHIYTGGRGSGSSFVEWNRSSQTIPDDKCFQCGNEKIDPLAELFCQACLATELKVFNGQTSRNN